MFPTALEVATLLKFLSINRSVPHQGHSVKGRFVLIFFSPSIHCLIFPNSFSMLVSFEFPVFFHWLGNDPDPTNKPIVILESPRLHECGMLNLSLRMASRAQTSIVALWN